MRRRRIAVIGTGGTISSLAEDSLDALDYPEFSRKIDAAELLARTPEAVRVADPVAVPFRAVSSTAIGPREWLALRELIHATAAADPALGGFVVTHGTSTLEETAFFLNLTLRTALPVVLVGAQRPASALGSDAGANLVAALRVAACPDAAGLGVLVVLNDEIHAARDVTKTSTYRLQTFRSPDFGPLGHVDGDAVRILRIPRGQHAPCAVFDAALATTGRLDLPRVDIVVSCAGADATMVEAAVAAGARGIISAGFAPGCATPAECRALERAAADGIVVVQSSRAGSGRVGRRRYLREAGIVAAEDFSPQKARILLMLALAQTSDVAEIEAMFEAA